MEKRIQLGASVKDRITGFTGICVARSEYLTGCDHIGIQTQDLDKDGMPSNYKWFDEPMVEIIAEPTPELLKAVEDSPKKGGPQQHSR